MATLTQDGFSLSIEFTSVGEDWVGYYISLMQGDVPMLNPRIYRDYANRRTAENRLRGTGADDSREKLIPLLEWALEQNQAIYWEPVDPDVTLAVYPDDVFPLAPAHRKVIRASEDESPFDWPPPDLAPNEVLLWTSEEADEEMAAYEAEKERYGGKHPDDPVCVIVKIDASVFAEGAYTSTGPALILSPSRRELESFLQDLKREYEQMENNGSSTGGLRAFTRASALAPERDADENG